MCGCRHDQPSGWGTGGRTPQDVRDITRSVRSPKRQPFAGVNHEIRKPPYDWTDGAREPGREDKESSTGPRFAGRSRRLAGKRIRARS
ncbi:hypothetical protein KR76_00129 [Pimelobacter simplex]|uniref:Uncharacterized protein n=1 Tax=Nocardioides simplex TaxID=2045 RepID=A0A0C5XBC2_NOCSI|nr:hypothetical protein KR76_00129 [Pimelobacter simplex]